MEQERHEDVRGQIFAVFATVEPQQDDVKRQRIRVNFTFVLVFS